MFKDGVFKSDQIVIIAVACAEAKRYKRQTMENQMRIYL